MGRLDGFSATNAPVHRIRLGKDGYRRRPAGV